MTSNLLINCVTVFPPSALLEVMQQHRSEGATRPPVSPTAWLTSWVGLEDSDTAALYRLMWGPRHLAVGRDTAQCEQHSRCVYIATISMIITLRPYSFANFQIHWQLHILFPALGPALPMEWHSGISTKKVLSPEYIITNTDRSLIFWWLPVSCHYLFLCASESEITIFNIPDIMSLLLKWKWTICLSNVLLTFSCSVSDPFRNGGFLVGRCERLKFSNDSKHCRKCQLNIGINCILTMLQSCCFPVFGHI